MVDIHKIPNALEVRLGMPRPAWNVIMAWLDQNVPASDWNAAWSECVGQWLDAMCNCLPSDYGIACSNHFWLLTGVPHLHDTVLSWCEHYRGQILAILSGIAQADEFSMAVLHFHNRETYLDYVLDFYPEAGEFSDSGGMFFKQGCQHLAIWGDKEWALEPKIAHELTHAAIAHLPLPLWLDEGVTQVIEGLALGRSSFLMNHEVAREHRAYWSEDSIKGFWSGSAFHAPDDGQRLSYSLAEVLVRNLVSDFPRKMPAILNAANQTDAGESAIRAACGQSLSERVAQFLGPGNWGPRQDGVVA